jgi:hypothetical protein
MFFCKMHCAVAFLKVETRWAYQFKQQLLESMKTLQRVERQDGAQRTHVAMSQSLGAESLMAPFAAPLCAAPLMHACTPCTWTMYMSTVIQLLETFSTLAYEAGYNGISSFNNKQHAVEVEHICKHSPGACQCCVLAGR